VDDYARRSGTAVDEVADLRSLVDECLWVCGPNLLAYLLGAGVDSRLADWRLETALSDPRALARLRTIHELLRLFGDPRVARGWLRNLNPDLDYRSPARLVRLGTEDDLNRVTDLAERQADKSPPAH
jgi:hypothetical protein